MQIFDREMDRNRDQHVSTATENGTTKARGKARGGEVSRRKKTYLMMAKSSFSPFVSVPSAGSEAKPPRITLFRTIVFV